MPWPRIASCRTFLVALLVATTTPPAARAVTLITPNGGEHLNSLQPFDIKWDVSTNTRVEYKIGSAAPVFIANAINGRLTWDVPELESKLVKIIVTVQPSGPADTSDASFSVCTVFEPLTNYDPGAAPLTVRAVDLDADGILDLATTSATGLHVLKGQGSGAFGDGTFAPLITIPVAGGTRQVAIADLDRDGRPDLIASGASGMTVVTRTGGGGYAAPVTIPAGGGPQGLAVADLDADGILDVVVVDHDVDSVAVLRGGGTSGVWNGTFTSAGRLAVGDAPQSVVIDDFDADRYPDLAVTNTLSNTVSVLLDDAKRSPGQVRFRAPVLLPSVISGPWGLACADFNEDGALDLIACAAGPGFKGCAAFLGTRTGGVPDGGFAAGVQYSTGMPGDLHDLAVGDVDGDGRADVVVYQPSSTGLACVLFGNGTGAVGNGTFTISDVWATGSGGEGLAVGNFEESAPHLDFAFARTVAARVGVSIGGCGPNTYITPTIASPNGGQRWVVGSDQTVSWNAGTGVVDYAIEISRDGGGAWQPLAAHAAGTSLGVLAPPDTTAAARVRVVDASLLGPRDASNANFKVCQSLGNVTVVPTDVAPRDPVVADFNEDGIDDVALSTTGDVAVHLGQGSGGVWNGTFSAGVAYATGGSTPSAITAGDFDGDGILDIAAGRANATGGGILAQIDLLRGLGAGGVGNGTFAAPVTVAFDGSNFPFKVETADLNEDGVLDLVWVCRDDDSVYVAYGNGTDGVGNGTFAPATGFPVGDGTQQMLLDDFDKDGILDLAVATAGTSNALYVMHGTGAAGHGDGGFGPASSVATGIVARRLLSADLDRDGIRDLVASDDQIVADSLVVLRGNGSGGVGDLTFTRIGTFPTRDGQSQSSTSSKPIMADLDRDGWPDLFVLANGGTVHLRHPARAFGPGDFAITQVLGTGSGGVAAADLDRDDVQDFVTATSAPNQLQVLRGQCGDGITHSLTITVPAGGEIWPVGSEQTIAWTRTSGVQEADVLVSRDAGANWTTVARHVSDTHFQWTVTAPASGNVRVRVQDSQIPSRISTSPNLLVPGVPTGVVERGPSLWLSAPEPNPGRTSVQLRLRLPNSAPVTAEVLDLSGRRVRMLAYGTFDAGEHSLVWDGRDRDGNEAGAGVYFVRVSIPGTRFTRRIVRVR
jgi:hypothetical protein